MAVTVWSKDTTGGHHVEATWTGAKTSIPTGALDGSVKKRTRYFFDVMVDDTYYFGSRFLTSADCDGVTDRRGVPILARTDLLVQLCVDRVASALETGTLDSIPNDLGDVDLDALVASDRGDVDD